MHLNTIMAAFGESHKKILEIKNQKEISNSFKSSVFVQTIANEIFNDYDHKQYSLSCQTVDFEKFAKNSGEWLLDAVISKLEEITETTIHGKAITKKLRIEIEWAIESEYDTSLKAFLDDFSKLLNLKAKNKLYLNGYCSLRLSSFETYKKTRLNTASQLINKYDPYGKYFFAFWPSPEKKGNTSFWNKINFDDKYLQSVLVPYEWNNDKLCFMPIPNCT